MTVIPWENSFNIRELSSKDEEKLRGFISSLTEEDRVYFSFFDGIHLEKLLDASRFLCVICAEDRSGQIVGYGHIEKFSQSFKQHVGRLGIAVHRAFRGRGLSRKLMEELIEIACSRNLSKIWLSVHLDNVRAVRLYERYGFKPEGIFFDEERRGSRASDIVSMALHVDALPVRTHVIPWGQPAIQMEEVESIMKVLHTGWLSQGPVTQAFEKKLAEYTGAEHMVVMNNGTSCLQAMFSLSFAPGDRVIFPAFTFVSTLNAALSAGIEPVLADVELHTGNIDLAMVEDILRRDRSIKGLVVVDIAGHPVDMKRCQDISLRYGVRLVEDAAEAIGSSCWGSRIGSFGHLTMFSFHAAKVITTIEGGAVATNDEETALRLRKFRNHGESLGKKFIWETYGLNLRLTDLQSAIGLAQIEKLDTFIEGRNRIAEFYRSRLARYVTFQSVDEYVDVHSYMMFIVLVESATQRMKIVEELKKQMVFCREGWLPLHKQPVFADRFSGLTLRVAEDWGERSLCLPMYNTMSVTDAEKVVAAIEVAFK